MFVLRASVWLKALGQFRPDIEQATRVSFTAKAVDGAFVRPAKESFAAVPAESIDYAVMERCPGSPIALRMVPLDAGWNDLGAWEAVWQVAEKDASGNASRGDAIIADSRNTLVHATSRLVSAVGLDNIVVVETPDAVLVARPQQEPGRQEDRQPARRRPGSQRDEQNLHREVYRPWGSYDSVDMGGRFQVKHITVKPGALAVPADAPPPRRALDRGFRAPPR